MSDDIPKRNDSNAEIEGYDDDGPKISEAQREKEFQKYVEEYTPADNCFFESPPRPKPQPKSMMTFSIEELIASRQELLERSSKRQRK